MNAALTDFLDLVHLVEADWTPSLHPRGPNGRFTESFARLMTPEQRGHARRAAAAFQPKRGINTPDGARTYLGSIGKGGPATATFFAGGHTEVNKALRENNDRYPGIKAMDAEMTPLPDDIVVTRRVPRSSLGDVTPEQLVDFRVADAGFTPASVATMDSGPDDVLLHIAVPKGTRAAIDPDSGRIVLDRGLEMSILHVAPNDRGGRDMYLIATPHSDGDDRGDGGPASPGSDSETGRRDAADAPDGSGTGDSSNGDAAGSAATPAPTVKADSDDTAPARADDGAAAGQQGSGSVLQRAAASATEEPTSLGEADPELRSAVHGAFTFQSGGLSASLDNQVSQVYRDGDGRTVVRAEGYIRNKDGRVVGSFRRMMYPDTGEVHNDTLALSGSEQGSGFAQQFAQHAEPQLADLGMRYATVSASGVGGYAWRRYGWDPDNPAAAGDVPDRLRTITANYDLSPEDKATVSGWLKAFAQPDQSKWPSPSEVGEFGKGRYDRKDSAGRTIWPGKDVLVDSAWKGRRDLQTKPSANQSAT